MSARMAQTCQRIPHGNHAGIVAGDKNEPLARPQPVRYGKCRHSVRNTPDRAFRIYFIIKYRHLKFFFKLFNQIKNMRVIGLGHRLVSTYPQIDLAITCIKERLILRQFTIIKARQMGSRKGAKKKISPSCRYSWTGSATAAVLFRALLPSAPTPRTA